MYAACGRAPSCDSPPDDVSTTNRATSPARRRAVGGDAECPVRRRRRFESGRSTRSSADLWRTDRRIGNNSHSDDGGCNDDDDAGYDQDDEDVGTLIFFGDVSSRRRRDSSRHRGRSSSVADVCSAQKLDDYSSVSGCSR